MPSEFETSKDLPTYYQIFALLLAEKKIIVPLLNILQKSNVDLFF